MAITIKSRDEAKIIEYIKKANACFDSGTTTLSNSNIQKFDSFTYALLNNVKFPSNLNFDEKIGILIQAIHGLHDDASIRMNNLTIDNIKNEIGRQYDAFSAQVSKKFYVIIPSKIKYSSLKKRHFILNGTKIKIRSFNYLMKNFDFKDQKTELFNENRTKEYFNPKFTFFEIEEFGRDKYKAGKLAWDKFELLRSIMNFNAEYKRIHHHFGRVDPISFLYPPNFFLVFSDMNEIVGTSRVIAHHSQREIDFQSHAKILKNTQKIISKLDALEKGNFQDLFIRSFLIHSNLLDNYDNKWISCFNLWQILETLTVFENNLNYDDLTRRITAQLKEKDLYHDVISVFKEKRNKFVHGGDTEVFSYEDIRLIKGVAEELLIHLLFNGYKFKNKQGLIYYYENLNLQQGELKKKKDMIDFIITKMR